MSKIEEAVESLWEETKKLSDCNINQPQINDICHYLGVNLFKADARLRAFSDPKELNYIKDHFVKAKLGVSDTDENILSVIRSIGQKYNTNKRALVYALLMEHYQVRSLK